jgi:hypothetical protein
MSLLMIFACMAMMPSVSSERAASAPPREIIIFAETWEDGASQWIGPSGGAHTGAIVPDPLNPANHVLTFSALADAGDIFSVEIPADTAFVYFLSFDYLGLPKEGTPGGNTGGRVGIAADSPGESWMWLAATIEGAGTTELIDDGQWHSCVTFFHPNRIPWMKDGTVRIMMEDWCGRPPEFPQGVPGDAFFDNIQIEVIRTAVQSTTWGALKEMFR